MRRGILEQIPSDLSGLFRKNLDQFLTTRKDLRTAEIEFFLKELDRLISLESKLGFKAHLPCADRLELAMQALQLAAHPEKVSQGRFNTCEVATIEKLLLTRKPSAVLNLVCDAATTGKIKNYSGVLSLSGEPFIKGLERLGNSRVAFSQIFQTALIEREWANRDLLGEGKTGTIAYRLGKPHPHATGDSGERLIHKQSGKTLIDLTDEDPDPKLRGFPVCDPGIDFPQMVRIYKSFAQDLGANPLVLCSEKAKRFLPEDKLHNLEFFDPAKGTAELKQILAKLNQANQLPIVVLIGDETNDLHVVTIRTYDESKGTVKIDDQKGADRTGKVVDFTSLNYLMTKWNQVPWQLAKPLNVELQRR